MESLVNYRLIVNDVSIHNNMLPDGEFSFNPQLHSKIDKLDDTHTAVTYILEIKNTDEKPFPVDIIVSLTGVFDISSLNECDVEHFLKVQTCQILFPQIRTIIATMTSCSLMPPILLPIIDARKLFSE